MLDCRMYPELHSHRKEPARFTHLWSQPPLSRAHSLSSERTAKQMYMTVDIPTTNSSVVCLYTCHTYADNIYSLCKIQTPTFLKVKSQDPTTALQNKEDWTNCSLKMSITCFLNSLASTQWNYAVQFISNDTKAAATFWVNSPKPVCPLADR